MRSLFQRGPKLDAASPLPAVVRWLNEKFEEIQRGLRRVEPAVPLTGSATWDPASVAAGAQTTTTVTVPGAALGDVVGVSFSLDLQGMQLTGYVSAADNVTAVLRNGTAGAIDLASGTLRASVWPS